ncbi:MAG: hypothetical protein NTY81_02040 [Candidatus Staskawiczbacteria bacterium]|nr:hypothetical protein [Candidatus Staskawiczbacteria bacterium]
MSRETEILDRLYYSFIDLANTKDFFYGLCDYLDYVESVPEFDQIANNLLGELKIVEDKLKMLDTICVEQIKGFHKELVDYLTKNNVDNAGIKEALNDYDGYLSGKIMGSRALTEALHDELSEVIRFLYIIPEHKEFALKYIIFWENSPNIKHFLITDEIKLYFDLLQEGRKRYETELWGKMNDIIRYYKIIKNGRERRKVLVKEGVENHSPKAMQELMMSHDILYGEWLMVEEGKSDRQPIFYKIEKVKPTMIRFQNHIILKMDEMERQKKQVKPQAISEGKVKVEKITIIELKNGRHSVAVNDGYNETREIKDNSESWQIFIKEIADKNIRPENRTGVKDISVSMRDYFNYNENCPIYMGGRYALTEVIVGRDIRLINPEIKTKIITQKQLLSLQKRKAKKLKTT